MDISPLKPSLDAGLGIWIILIYALGWVEGRKPISLIDFVLLLGLENMLFD